MHAARWLLSVNITSSVILRLSFLHACMQACMAACVRSRTFHRPTDCLSPNFCTLRFPPWFFSYDGAVQVTETLWVLLYEMTHPPSFSSRTQTASRGRLCNSSFSKHVHTSDLMHGRSHIEGWGVRGCVSSSSLSPDNRAAAPPCFRRLIHKGHFHSA